jgi:peptidyl-prolyl isomerase D
LCVGGTCPECRQNPVKIVNDLYDLKEQGNKASKNRRYRRAIELYSQSLSRLDKLTDIPKLRFALHSNLALMHLRLRAWNDAKEHASFALKTPDILDKQHARALYRLGLANMGLENWESAQTALEEAKRYAPDEATIEQALEELRVKGSFETEEQIRGSHTDGS